MPNYTLLNQNSDLPKNTAYLFAVRDLTLADIDIIATFQTWPVQEAVVYVLGKFPTGDISLHSIAADTDQTFAAQFMEITERLKAARLAKEPFIITEDGPGNVKFHYVRPLDFFEWLDDNDFTPDPKLVLAVTQFVLKKKKRNEERIAGTKPDLPPFILPNDTDQELYQAAIAYVGNDNSYETDGMTPQELGGKKTATSIRLFRQNAYYYARLHMKIGCTCLSPNLTLQIIELTKDDTKGLNKKHKISDYVEAAVVAALKSSPESAYRVCSDRYPTGKSPNLKPCPYHPEWNTPYTSRIP